MYCFTFKKGYIVSHSIIVFLFEFGKSPLIDRVRMLLSSSDKSSKAINSDCFTYTSDSSCYSTIRSNSVNNLCLLSLHWTLDKLYAKIQYYALNKIVMIFRIHSSYGNVLYHVIFSIYVAMCTLFVLKL